MHARLALLWIRSQYSRRARGGNLAVAAAMLVTVFGAPLEAAPSAGGTLRDYLRARAAGNNDAARALWDPRDLRRASALGIVFPDVDAAYDDYWMHSAATRRTSAAPWRPVVRDSVALGNGARFTVVLEAGTGVADTLSYLVQQVEGAWRVSLPYLEATREWTRRDSRFLRLRAKRLVLVSQHALTAVDAEIARLFEQLGAPQAAQLRLERIKLEYYLVEDDDDVRALVGTTRRLGYQPAGGRVVARVLPDMSAVARALVHVTLRNVPLHNEPMFDAGLAAALGGTPDLGAAVFVQRAIEQCRRDPAQLDKAFDATSDADALTSEAVWNRVLLDELGAEAFLAMVRSTAGTPPAAGGRNVAARRAIEKATGQSGAALTQRVQKRLATYRSTIVPGCETWPADLYGVQPFLRWRDAAEHWGLLGYEIGDEYLFTVAPYDPALPKWMRQTADSLAAEFVGEKPEWEIPEVKRPTGDPMPIVLLVRAKLEEDLEPYESRLFEQQFLARDYKNDLFGLFVTPDDVRLYDYTRNKLLAEFTVQSAPPGGLVYYDETPGRICFRFPKSLIPRPLTSYYVFLSQHTGE